MKIFETERLIIRSLEKVDKIYFAELFTDPKICIHAEQCAQGLSEVFRTTVIPWINLDGIDENQRIINQIRKCPSGALQFCRNKKEAC